MIEPIFERDFAEHSYGFRPGRGCKDALRRVDELLKAGYVLRRGRRPEELLRHDPARPPAWSRLRGRIADGRVLALIEAFLQARRHGRSGRVDARSGHAARRGAQPAAEQHLPGPAGPPDGRAGFEMVRYADDFVILCRSAEEADRGPGDGADVGGGNRPDAAPDEDADRRRRTEGFDFLGYRFERRPNAGRGRRAWTKLKDTIRAKTRRTHGDSLTAIIADVNRTLRGWFGTSSTVIAGRFGRWTLDPPTPAEHPAASARPARTRPWRGPSRWPNAFFAEQGLFSLSSSPCSGPSIPRRGKTIDWRAGCGRSARPVRREGGRKPMRSSLPLSRDSSPAPSAGPNAVLASCRFATRTTSCPGHPNPQSYPANLELTTLEAHLPADVADVVPVGRVAVDGASGKRGGAAEGEPAVPVVDPPLQPGDGLGAARRAGSNRPSGARRLGVSRSAIRCIRFAGARGIHARRRQGAGRVQQQVEAVAGGRRATSWPIARPGRPCSATQTVSRPARTSWYSSSSISRSRLRTSQA